MRRKGLALALATITALAFTIVTISYGYWTDKLSITGEGAFEYNLPIYNDLNVLDEEISDIVIPKETLKKDVETQEVQAREEEADADVVLDTSVPEEEDLQDDVTNTH
jgi:hypothetical protein